MLANSILALIKQLKYYFFYSQCTRGALRWIGFKQISEVLQQKMRLQ